ncbi:hsp70 family protein [Corallincola spongiicola]|uniref:Molecular chaperone DnaK n=1 Tax=Corallincola spongiicola TaxID=2520508 RepID=A0ABY1WRZ7_9GAMM|nr:hsp70 family protein [Corallincola spongiicola]TAA47474.1 molecular chaperone DnaK [Corallincola spongiicola]
MTTSNTESARYVIGIDLGTSNIVLAYAKLGRSAKPSAAASAFQVWPIPQWLDKGQWGTALTLPALRYHPGAEVSAAQQQLPWPSSQLQQQLPNALLGHWAQQLGSAMPGRLVQSAKSWLCQQTAETALPWRAEAHVATVSPLQATASYLDYLRCAWDHQFADAPMAQQQLQITVPASFDDHARALTQEAAALAGLNQPVLLEEPIAATYDWLLREADSDTLADREQMLVCDIGGGTSDFTLINIKPSAEQKRPQLERVAVGEHLMLGGDNVDLALAVQAQRKLNTSDKAARPDFKQLQQLSQQSRQAKETLLATDPPDEFKINLLGSGSALIGGTQQTRLTAKEVEQLALDGFFPLVDSTAYPQQRKGALVQTGLPYPADAAITRHLAAFLAPHIKQTGITPDTLLLNGSPFHSPQLRQRLIAQLQQWSERPITLLENPAPDLAVARGAAYYGWLRQQKQQLIRSDSARSYFAIVDSQSGKQAFCILPKGSATDHSQTLSTPDFTLMCGEPVQFEIASDHGATRYQLGQRIADSHQLHHLPKLTTELAGSGMVNVRLSTRLTELGQLAVACQAIDEPTQQWPISFNLRAHEQADIAPACQSTPTAAFKLIHQVFGSSKAVLNVSELRNQLEKQLGKRDNWSADTARHLADQLLETAGKRRRSLKHERIWFNLSGYCLRPGSGMPNDNQRISQLWQLYTSGLQYQQENQGWREWWVLWRRVVAGLNDEQQATLLDDIGMVLVPGYARSAGNKPRQQAGIEERIRLIGALERIPVEVKTEVGNLLLDKLQKQDELAASSWALARIGARRLAYATPEFRITADVVSEWLQTLLTLDWKQHPQLCFPAVTMAQPTDSALAVNDDLRRQVSDKLRRGRRNEGWLRWLSDDADQAGDQQQIWGDNLPTGLRLAED